MWHDGDVLSGTIDAFEQLIRHHPLTYIDSLCLCFFFTSTFEIEQDMPNLVDVDSDPRSAQQTAAASAAQPFMQQQPQQTLPRQQQHSSAFGQSPPFASHTPPAQFAPAPHSYFHQFSAALAQVPLHAQLTPQSPNSSSFSTQQAKHPQPDDMK